ncbi:low temperature requirement protein A [Catenulispora yoronensis]|uniref:low temperature requirement protein A n=1 Tax=Catenulispora yoronensis TaxID=450799 RepID=UPI0031D3A092
MATQEYEDTPIEPDQDDGTPDIEADADPAPRSPHAVQRVTWAELFFDLVFVFAVTQVAHAVSVGDGWADLGRSLLLFVPFWWTWVGCTIVFNGLVVSATKRHVLLLAVAGAAFVMSIAVPDAYGDRGLLFGAAYCAARILLGYAMHVRGAFRARLNPYTVGLAAGPAWLLAGLAPEGARQWIWLALAVLELSVPIVLGHRLDYMRFDASHLPERFGLFVIIALGETLVGIGQGGTHEALDGVEGTALFVAFLLSCGLWWTYFQYGASATEHALRTARIPAVLVRSTFSYGHLAFVIGIILAAAGMSQAVADPKAHLEGLHAMLLGSGVSLYIATFCYTRIVMFGGASYTRVVGALLAIVVTVFSPGLPALTPLILLAALVIALNAFELYWVDSGRPLLVINIGQGAAGR